ncbi:MAG: hypothetical protein ACFB0C_20325 [Leptolyngbyaceae cyanobacterium]
MSWIIEQFFSLAYDLLTGQATNSEKLIALIPLTLIVGILLAWRQIWDVIVRLRRRSIRFARIQEFDSEVSKKREKIERVVDEIEGKIYDLNAQASLFRRKRDEALKRLRALTAKIHNNSELYSLKENIDDLSETHGVSVDTIKEIRQLLDQIIDVSRGEELQRNARSLGLGHLADARKQRALNNSRKNR